jgi:deoxyribonuclease V
VLKNNKSVFKYFSIYFPYGKTGLFTLKNINKNQLPPKSMIEYSSRELKKLREIQKKIAQQASTKDALKTDQIKTIAGFDLAFTNQDIISAGVVMSFPDMKIVEKKFTICKEPMKYIPSFLAFREGPPIMETYTKLENKPDLLLFDGNGILHPKKAGIATHVGVMLDKPAIGVAKKLLCGKKQEDNIIMNEKIIAKTLQTKQHAKPIIISPGHKISLNTAVKVVKKCLRGHKLPEPIHEAHKYANKIKNKLKLQPET